MEFDSKSVSVAAAAFAAVVALPLLASAGPAPTPQFTAEKCYGVAAAGQNDCQTASHSCAGESKLSSGPEFLDLRPDRHLREDQRRQPQKLLTKATGTRPRS